MVLTRGRLGARHPDTPTIELLIRLCQHRLPARRAGTDGCRHPQRGSSSPSSTRRRARLLVVGVRGPPDVDMAPGAAVAPLEVEMAGDTDRDPRKLVRGYMAIVAFPLRRVGSAGSTESLTGSVLHPRQPSGH